MSHPHLFSILIFSAVYGVVDFSIFTPVRERWYVIKSLFTVCNPFTVMAWICIGFVLALIAYCFADYYIAHRMGWF